MHCSAIWFIQGKIDKDWESYIKQFEQFNDMTQEQYAALPKDAPNRPDMVYFILCIYVFMN